MGTATAKIGSTLSSLRDATKKKTPWDKVKKTVSELSPAKIGDKLKKEQEVSRFLHKDVEATIKRMTERDEGLRKAIDEAYGYAVYPSIGRAGAVLGVSFGKGEVFKQGKLIGYSGAVQVTIGVQLGGQTYSELVLLQNKEALDRFKAGKVGFAANASVVLVKAGASAANNYKGGMQVFVLPTGGMMLDLDIGGQKLFFRPAGLTRGKKSGWEGRQGQEEPQGPSASA